MLKIDVIKFEAQDVITISIPDMNVVTGGAPVNPVVTCYCNDDCLFNYVSGGTGWYVHATHDPCSDCRKTGPYPVD